MKSDEDDVDPCTGFPTTHKAKLSIPSIHWTRYGRTGSISKETTPVGGDSDMHNSNGILRHLRMMEKPSRPHNHCIGILLTVLSAITFSFNALVIKLLSHFHPFNLGFWTFILMTLLGVLAIIYEVKVKGNENIFESVFPFSLEDNRRIVTFLLLRSCSGIFALILFFYSVKYLTVADALVIDASSPIFVFLMAFLFFGEKFGIVPLFTTILALAGVALITRPPLLLSGSGAEYDMNSVIGVALAFSAMICISVQIILLKFLTEVHYTLVNCTLGLFGSIQCLLVAWACGVLVVPTEFNDIAKIFASAVLFYLGQAFITLALQREDVGPVGLVRTTEVMFIFMWQFLFLGVIPDFYSCLGASLVLFGVILTILRKWIGTLPTDNDFRTNCNLLLY